MKIFEKQRNTLAVIELFDKNRNTKLLDKPKRFEEDPNWIAVTDPEEFKRITPLVMHRMANYLDEYAVYCHKTSLEYNKDRFKDYKEQLVEVIGEDKVIAILHKNKLYAEDLNFYELAELIKIELEVEVILDDENGEITTKDFKALPKGTNWEEYTKPELKDLLKSKGLAVSGTNKILIQRIEDNKGLFGIKEDKGEEIKKPSWKDTFK